jgi:hypothetical protein
MGRHLVALICTAAVLGLASVPAAAQQKTAKQCNEEWTTNKATIQASGKTKKAFVAECRGQGPAVTAPAPKPTTAAAPKPARTAAPGAAGNVKTAKQCNDEWSANKAAIQAGKKTKKQFMAECRAQPPGSTTTAAPSSTPPPTPAPAKPSSTTAPSPPPATAAPSRRPATPAATARPPTTAATPSSAGQFSTEAQAKTRCPGDTVVWVNLDSKVYHFAGNRNYGTTKTGAYMCEKDAAAAGSRAAKNEKHP